MGKIIPSIRLISLVLFFALALPFIYSESHLSYVEGEVYIQRGLQQIEGDFGVPLKIGDIVKTEIDSFAILELEDRGTLKLRSDSSIVIENLDKNISVSLVSGGVFSRVNKLLGWGYEVRTPDMVAGVRGTEFFVAYGKKIEETPDLWLCVNEGTVEVSVTDQEESVLVNKGQGINIPAGLRLTDPQFYAWTEDLNWNMDPDNGKVSDDTNLDAAYEDLRDFDYD